jgi:hypothetical protein
MIKRTLAATAVLILSILPAAHSGAVQGEMERALGELEAYFPGVEGYVVSVLDQTIYTDIPAEAGVRPGSELAIFREGDEIVHPLTGQVLGHFEKILGIIRVEEVRGEYTTGLLVGKDPGSEIKPGDRVRISSSQLRVGVVLPDFGEEESEEWFIVQNEVLMALEKSDRFLTADPTDDLTTEMLDDADAVKKIAAESGFNAILGLELDGPPRKRILQIRLYSAATGVRLATARAEVGTPKQAAAPTAAYGVQVPAAVARLESADQPWGAFYLRHSVRSLCAGRLTGGEGVQLAVADTKSLYVYGREGSGWDLLWEDKGNRGTPIVTVDCGDIDGNGLEEIIVTRISRGILRSKGLEYRGGVFVEKTDAKNRFYRVVKTGPDSWRLFAQKLNKQDPTKGRVEEYAWDGGGYSSAGGGTLPLPSVHGLGMADVDGDGELETLIVGRDDRIYVYKSSGDLIWKSRERFGGSNLFLDAENLDQNLPVKEIGGYLVKGRVLGTDLDGDGRWEVILTRNIPKLGFLENTRLFDRSEIGLFSWDGQALRELAPLDEFQGYLADYEVIRYADGSAEIIVGLAEKGSLFKEGEGRLMSRFYQAAAP